MRSWVAAQCQDTHLAIIIPWVWFPKLRQIEYIMGRGRRVKERKREETRAKWAYSRHSALILQNTALGKLLICSSYLEIS